MKKKRITAILAAATLVLGLTACGSGNKSADNTSAKKDEEVTIGVYSGDWKTQIDEAALQDFEKETGIKVNIVEGADAEWVSKVEAADGKNVPYDILVLMPNSIRELNEKGLLENLDSDKVSNIADLYPLLLKEFENEDGTYHAVPFAIGQLGLMYRADLVDTAPTSWSDLWNEEYKGHVAISPLTYTAGLQFFSGLLQTRSEDEVFADLAKLKDSVSSLPDSAGAVQTLIERGDAWVIPYWDGRAYSLKEQGLDVGFAYPTDGAVCAASNWVVLKNAPHLDNAYELLNKILSPESCKSFSEASYYGTANQKTEYSDDFLSKVQVGEEFYESLVWVDYDQVDQKLNDWVQKWQEALN